MTTHGNWCWNLSVCSAIFKNTCGMFRKLLVIQLLFFFFFFSFVSIVRSREWKRLNRYSDKIKGIVCRTVYILCTYLCNDSSVPLIFCSLCLVTYQAIIPISTQMPSRWLAVIFFIRAVICLHSFIGKWGLFASVCLLSVFFKYFVCISHHICFSDHHNSIVV